ncbi:MAG: hypothetical protein JST83_13445 [Bacteroidetes bacterium]|nr:hypothetical protein [Bacteroidota bacterium]
MMVIGSTLMAQEKYEQGVVEQFGRLLMVSMEGKEDQNIKADDKNVTGRTFALNYLASLRNEGWEVWNSAPMPSGTIFFIRRKLK